MNMIIIIIIIMIMIIIIIGIIIVIEQAAAAFSRGHGPIRSHPMRILYAYVYYMYICI